MSAVQKRDTSRALVINERANIAVRLKEMAAGQRASYISPLASAETPRKGVYLVVSAGRGATSASLGAAIATLTHRRLRTSVLLVDLCWNDSGVSQKIGAETLPGVRDVLNGLRFSEELIVHAEPFDLLPCGTEQLDEQDWRRRKGLAPLIELLGSLYDVVFIAISSATQEYEISEAAQEADGAYIAIEYGAADRREVQAVQTVLEGAGAKVRGLITRRKPDQAAGFLSRVTLRRS